MANAKPFEILLDEVEPQCLRQFAEAMEQPSYITGSLMPDAHTGYTVPIGSTIVSDGVVFPSYVGNDIGCGVLHMRYPNMKEVPSRVQLEQIRDDILKVIPVGQGTHDDQYRKLDNKQSELFNKLNDEDLKLKFMKHLGTLGGGNHFIELGWSEVYGCLALTIHSGSRGLGSAIAREWMTKARDYASVAYHDMWKREFSIVNTWREHGPAKWEYSLSKYIQRRAIELPLEGHHALPIDEPIGKQYITAMQLAIEYARLNRADMAYKVFGAIRRNICPESTEQYGECITDTTHNYATVEYISELGKTCVIHRKGANRADGIIAIPGNMRDGVIIAKGTAPDDVTQSCSHGAGRVMSRAQARCTFSEQDLAALQGFLVSNHTVSVIDELPDCYKDIDSVMNKQVRKVYKLDEVTPLLNIKG